jgi:hypothetical protein
MSQWWHGVMLSSRKHAGLLCSSSAFGAAEGEISSKARRKRLSARIDAALKRQDTRRICNAGDKVGLDAGFAYLYVHTCKTALSVPLAQKQG